MRRSGRDITVDEDGADHENALHSPFTISSFPSASLSQFPFPFGGRASTSISSTPTARGPSTSVIVVTSETTVVQTSISRSQSPTVSSQSEPGPQTSSAFTSSSTRSSSGIITSTSTTRRLLSNTKPTLRPTIHSDLTGKPSPSRTANPPSSTFSGIATSTSSTKDSAIPHKYAIIGGLSGAIAGLIFIGIIFCWIFHRRKQQQSRDSGGPRSKANDDYNGEKRIPSGPPVLPFPELNPARYALPPKPLPPLPTQPAGHYTRTGTPASELRAPARHNRLLDEHLIRVSLDRWPRPFLSGEGYRESMGPAHLRVTNPDRSGTATPLKKPQIRVIGVTVSDQSSSPAVSPPPSVFSSSEGSETQHQVSPLPSPPPPRTSAIIGLALTTTTPTPSTTKMDTPFPRDDGPDPFRTPASPSLPSSSTTTASTTRSGLPPAVPPQHTLAPAASQGVHPASLMPGPVRGDAAVLSARLAFLPLPSPAASRGTTRRASEASDPFDLDGASGSASEEEGDGGSDRDDSRERSQYQEHREGGARKAWEGVEVYEGT